MIRIHARSNSTKMVKVHPVGDVTFKCLIYRAMSAFL